jgi:hypothetical protein
VQGNSHLLLLRMLPAAVNWRKYSSFKQQLLWLDAAWFYAHLILLGCQQHAPDSNQLQHCAWDTLQAAAAAADSISTP